MLSARGPVRAAAKPKSRRPGDGHERVVPPDRAHHAESRHDQVEAFRRRGRSARWRRSRSPSRLRCPAPPILTRSTGVSTSPSLAVTRSSLSLCARRSECRRVGCQTTLDLFQPPCPPGPRSITGCSAAGPCETLAFASREYRTRSRLPPLADFHSLRSTESSSAFSSASSFIPTPRPSTASSPSGSG